MTDWTNHMTQEMLDNLPDEQLFVAEYELCHERYLAARKCYLTSLPATAASGEPVLHGARRVLENVADYWLNRRNLARNFLTRTTLLEIEKRLDDE